MITSDICSVKGIKSQKPRPQPSTTWPALDGVSVRPAMTTTSVATSANTNASGTHLSVHAVSASAERATTPASSTDGEGVPGAVSRIDDVSVNARLCRGRLGPDAS